MKCELKRYTAKDFTGNFGGRDCAQISQDASVALDFPYTVYLSAIFPGRNFSRQEEKFLQCSTGRQKNILPGTSFLH